MVNQHETLQLASNEHVLTALHRELGPSESGPLIVGPSSGGERGPKPDPGGQKT